MGLYFPVQKPCSIFPVQSFDRGKSSFRLPDLRNRTSHMPTLLRSTSTEATRRPHRHGPGLEEHRGVLKTGFLKRIKNILGKTRKQLGKTSKNQGNLRKY